MWHENMLIVPADIIVAEIISQENNDVRVSWSRENWSQGKRK